MKVKGLQFMVMAAVLMGTQVSGIHDVHAASTTQKKVSAPAATSGTAVKSKPAAGTNAKQGTLLKQRAKTGVSPTGTGLKSPVKTVRSGNQTGYRPLLVKAEPAKPAAVNRASLKSDATKKETVKAAAVKKEAPKTDVKKKTAPKPNAVKTEPVKSTATKTETVKPAAERTKSKASAPVPVVDKKEQMPDVRVLLGSRKQNAFVTSSSGLSIRNSANKQVGTIGANRKTTVGIKGNSIVVNGKSVDSVVTLQPANGDAPFLFEGKGYRGGLTLRAHNGTMMVINAVPLEQYLYGVVAQEVIPSWPAAALEAQAVAARTYALHTMERSKSQLYDVSPTTDHQVYGGVSGEAQSTTAAVNKTKGVVMLYNNRPINALFHADGGGYTEDSVNVWGNDVPYLKGVKDFSKSSDSSNWTVMTSRQALEGKLNAASKGVGKLKSIQLTPLGKPGKQTADRGVSGRIKTATFVGSSGKVTISGDDLRNILGLKSTLFDFYVNHKPGASTGKAYHKFTGKNDAVYIKGHGWGHGLGLSQWGAAEMAKQAKPGDPDFYQTILKHYYSGITLKKMY